MKIAVIIKYNPCTIHARLGSKCPYFDTTRHCPYPLGECPDPNYDLWYRKVLEGEMKEYYPFHIRILDEPGSIMLIYHSHKKAIVGEAKIVGHRVDNGRHYYRFEEFVVYPKPVPLEMIYVDERLKKLRRRWIAVYIDRETLDEIRELAGLKGDLKKRLEREIELAEIAAKKALERRARRKYVKITPEIFIKSIENDIVNRFGQEAFEEAKKIFYLALERGLTKGRGLRNTFYTTLYIALRKLGFPIALWEYCEQLDLELKRTRKYYRQLITNLGIKVPPIDPEELIRVKAEPLGMSENAVEKAIVYLETMRKSIRGGVSPYTIAATAVYLTLKDEGATQEKIAKVFGITPVSIRNLLKTLS